MLRKLENKDIVGKTVSAIDNKSVNVLKLSFTDGTSIELWTETAVNTSAGVIYGIYVDDGKKGAG